MTTANILSQLGSPGVSTGFKNRIINGAMVIDQRNNGAIITLSGAENRYPVDRFPSYASVGTVTAQQSSTAPAGFTNSIVYTVTSPVTVSGSDNVRFAQNIEGYNVADLGFGTANAKTVTLSFWVRSSLTGTFGGSLRNSASDRSYVFSYTISSANTWEYKTVTIAGDTSGTWLTTNGVGIRLFWSLGVGSTFQTSAGSWLSGTYYAPTGSVSLVGTSGATLYITGVQFEVGTTATNFDFRSYTNELQLCQRYTVVYSNPGDPGNNRFFGYAYATTSSLNTVTFPVTMRTNPSVTVSTASAFTLYTQLAAPAISTIALDASSTKNANLNTVPTSASLNSGQGTILAFNTPGNQVIFSAEL